MFVIIKRILISLGCDTPIHSEMHVVKLCQSLCSIALVSTPAVHKYKMFHFLCVTFRESDVHKHILMCFFTNFSPYIVHIKIYKTSYICELMEIVGFRRCECVYSGVYACVPVYIVQVVLKMSLL